MPEHFDAGNSWVRLTSISIDDLKNVEHGELSFSTVQNTFGASVLGLYGQNGSGKTALIDAIGILACILRRQGLQAEDSNLINAAKESSRLCFVFEIGGDGWKCTVDYSFLLKRASDPASAGPYPAIEDEVLRFSYSSNDEIQRMSTAIDTSGSQLFTPRTRLEELVGSGGEEQIIDLMVEKKLSHSQSKSFVFSAQLASSFAERAESEESSPFIRRTMAVLSRLS